MRPKIPMLTEALRGFFTDHHATLLPTMLSHIDWLTDQITTLDQQIIEAVTPYARQVEQLCQIPGVKAVAAYELIGEIGVDMSRFLSAAHLVSWAKFSPTTHESAGKAKRKRRAKGNPWLAGTLGNIVASASKTDTFLGARYRRLRKRKEPMRAIVACGNTVLTHAYQLMSNPNADYAELGADHYTSRIDPNRRARQLAHQLQQITGQTIIIHNGKMHIAEPTAV